MSEVILDVRERDEFEAEHVEHSINVSLSHFAVTAPGVLNQLRERDVVVMCRSGNRARLAATQIVQLGYSDKVSAKVFDGGILEWKKLGRPTITKRAGHLPIMRQAQLAVGLLVLSTVLLGVLVNPWFLAGTAFVGTGLTVAGSTGFCGLANLLALMPWNKQQPGVKEELCSASPKSSGCAN